MKKDREGQKHNYVPPTPEELGFDTRSESRKSMRGRLDSLIEKQRQGIKLGILPQYPRGLARELRPRWRRKVWNPWLKDHPEEEGWLGQGLDLHTTPPDEDTGQSGTGTLRRRG